MLIRVATHADVDDVSALLLANSVQNGGQLYGDWTVGAIRQWIDEGALILLAMEGSALLGVLFAIEKVQAIAPTVLAMLEAWPGSSDAYVYGPVCVSAEARGRSVLRALYHELSLRRPGREAILFIRRSNAQSLRAHRKLGMNAVATFMLGGDDFIVFSTMTSATNQAKDPM
jgi:ribosomal protein S18 acetylase RimI-like enzyme